MLVPGIVHDNIHELSGSVAIRVSCRDEDNVVRVVDAFINVLDMVALGFEGVTPATTGRQSYRTALPYRLRRVTYRAETFVLAPASVLQRTAFW
jgi:hypothetical protein